MPLRCVRASTPKRTKTGNDAGFAESEWFDGCYEPKGANASRPRAGTGDY